LVASSPENVCSSSRAFRPLIVGELSIVLKGKGDAGLGSGRTEVSGLRPDKKPVSLSADFLPPGRQRSALACSGNDGNCWSSLWGGGFTPFRTMTRPSVVPDPGVARRSSAHPSRRLRRWSYPSSPAARRRTGKGPGGSVRHLLSLLWRVSVSLACKRFHDQGVGLGGGDALEACGGDDGARRCVLGRGAGGPGLPTRTHRVHRPRSPGAARRGGVPGLCAAP
jgi:hypothetical protein